MNTLIDFETLEQEIEAHRIQFTTAEPFEHLVIDNFLKPEGLSAVQREGFSHGLTTTDKSSDFLFAKNKMENPKLEEISEVTRHLREELLSDRFREFLKGVTELDLFVDDTFTGGGLHQGGQGSFLEMHADFTRHPVNRNWIRELNILLYLNTKYEVAWGGNLDLEHKDSGDKASIAPIDNRLVLMLTKPHTLHGYRPIKFPPNRLRASVAAYAYTLDDGTRNVQYSSTRWRPESTTKRAISLLWNPLVVVKQKLFGSRTAKRAKRD